MGVEKVNSEIITSKTKAERIQEIVDFLEANKPKFWTLSLIRKNFVGHRSFFLQSGMSWRQVIDEFPKKWRDCFEISSFKSLIQEPSIERNFIIKGLRNHLLRRLNEVLEQNESKIKESFCPTDIYKWNQSIYDRITRLTQESKKDTWYTLVLSLSDKWKTKFKISVGSLDKCKLRLDFELKAHKQQSWSFSSWKRQNPKFYYAFLHNLNLEKGYIRNLKRRQQSFLESLPPSIQEIYNPNEDTPDAIKDNRTDRVQNYQKNLSQLESWIAGKQKWTYEMLKQEMIPVLRWIERNYSRSDFLTHLSSDSLNKLVAIKGSKLKASQLAEKIKRQVGDKIKSSWSIADIQSAEIRAEVQDAMKSGLFEKALATNLLLQWSFNPWEARGKMTEDRGKRTDDR